jgi:CheY-like chemotaxis protein
VDISMPIMDRFELLEAIRKLHISEGVIPPTVLLTTSAKAQDREKARKGDCLKACILGYANLQGRWSTLGQSVGSYVASSRFPYLGNA